MPSPSLDKIDLGSSSCRLSRMYPCTNLVPFSLRLLSQRQILGHLRLIQSRREMLHWMRRVPLLLNQASA